MGNSNDLEIWFATTSGGDEGLADAQAGLTQELREIPGLTIEPISGGAAPAGTKAGELAAAALLLPALVPAFELLKITIGTVREWMGRQPATTTIKVKIGDVEVEWSGGGPVPEAITRLLEAATARHTS